MKRVLAALFLAACGAPPPPAPPLPAPPPPPAREPALEIGKDALTVRDASGQVLWRASHDRYQKVLVAQGRVLIARSGRVALRDLASGAERGSVSLDGDALVRETVAPEVGFRVPLRLYPAAAGRTAERALAVGADGTILVGASDGSLLAFDPGGAPRFQTGVRGAVRSIEARPDGTFAVETRAGDVVVGPEGVRAEAPPRGAPSLAFRVQPNLLQEPPVDRLEVASTLYVARDDVWALTGDWAHRRVYHHDGKAWREVPAPGLHPLDRRCWLAGTPERERRCNALPVGQDEVQADRLARTPEGKILLLATRRYPMRAAPAWVSVELAVFEYAGSAFRERAELRKALDKTRVEMGGHGGLFPLYAAAPGGKEVLCLNGECLARGLPPAFRSRQGAAVADPAGPRGWVHFSTEGNDAFQPIGLTFGGQALFRLDETGISRDGVVVDPDAACGGYSDLWASGDEVWAVCAGRQQNEESQLTRGSGKAFTHVPTPVPDAYQLGGTGPDDVWIAGQSSAHFDGRAFTALSGVSGAIVVVGREEAWIGRWHVSRDPAPQPDLAGAPAPLPAPAPESRALALGSVDPRVRLEPASLGIFPGALGLAQGPDGQVWIHDTRRIAVVAGDSARLVHSVSSGGPLRCQRCLAPAADGKGLALTPAEDRVVSLVPLAAPGAPPLTRAPDLLALARSPSGAVWIVGAAEGDAAPRALVHTAAGLRLVRGLPLAAYADVAPWTDDDVWLAGGLSSFHDGVRAWPEGEGLLVHFDGRAFTRHRAPDGALLAVVAVGPGEAWAVGRGGGLLHVKAGTAEAFHLEGEGGKALRVALRAVAASGPDDVWIAGDGSTLLRWDGKSLRRVDARAAGPDAAFTALIVPSAAPGWLAGPSGLWRLRPAP